MRRAVTVVMLVAAGVVYTPANSEAAPQLPHVSYTFPDWIELPAVWENRVVLQTPTFFTGAGGHPVINVLEDPRSGNLKYQEIKFECDSFYPDISGNVITWADRRCGSPYYMETIYQDLTVGGPWRPSYAPAFRYNQRVWSDGALADTFLAWEEQATLNSPYRVYMAAHQQAPVRVAKDYSAEQFYPALGWKQIAWVENGEVMSADWNNLGQVSVYGRGSRPDVNRDRIAYTTWNAIMVGKIDGPTWELPGVPKCTKFDQPKLGYYNDEFWVLYMGSDCDGKQGTKQLFVTNFDGTNTMVVDDDSEDPAKEFQDNPQYDIDDFGTIVYQWANGRRYDLMVTWLP